MLPLMHVAPRGQQYPVLPTQGRPGNFPKTMVKTMRILTNYVPPPRLQHARNPDGEKLAFIQGKGGASHGAKKESANKEVECWHCGGPYYKNECPELKLLDTGIQNINLDSCNEEHTLFSTDDGYSLVQKQAKGVWGILSPHHMYIDTCASYASTPYAHLLTNLKKQTCGLVGHSNAGSRSMSSSGEIGALTKVWLSKGNVATILPLKELEKLWQVVYDSRKNGGAFVLRTDAGNIVIKNNDKGMPYLDLKDFEAEAALSLVQTVRGDMEGFTKREVEEARRACEVQGMWGHPTDRNFLGMVRGGMISNCPVTPTAVQNTHQIFGPDLAGIRGRMVWRPPDSVTTN